VDAAVSRARIFVHRPVTSGDSPHSRGLPSEMYRPSAPDRAPLRQPTASMRSTRFADLLNWRIHASMLHTTNTRIARVRTCAAGTRLAAMEVRGALMSCLSSPTSVPLQPQCSLLVAIVAMSSRVVTRRRSVVPTCGVHHRQVIHQVANCPGRA
jgi:hypothetical protein